MFTFFIETTDRLRTQVSKKNRTIKINGACAGDAHMIIEVESTSLLVEGIRIHYKYRLLELKY